MKRSLTAFMERAWDANFKLLRGKSQVMIRDLLNSPSGNTYWQAGILRAMANDRGDGDPHLDADAPDYCELGDLHVDARTGTILSPGNLHTPTSGKDPALKCDS